MPKKYKKKSSKKINNSNIITDSFYWVKNIILNPATVTKNDMEYRDFFKKLIILSIIPGVLSSVISYYTNNLLLFTLIIPLSIIFSIIAPIIFSAIAHFFGKVLFRIVNGNYKKTYNSYAYSYSIYLLTYWIPFIGPIISSIWSLFIGIHAVSNQHKVSKLRALVFLMLPVIIIISIFSLIFTIYFTTLSDEYGKESFENIIKSEILKEGNYENEVLENDIDYNYNYNERKY